MNVHCLSSTDCQHNNKKNIYRTKLKLDNGLKSTYIPKDKGIEHVETFTNIFQYLQMKN